MEWGRAAEKRAMQWLKARGKKPVDVSSFKYGWDIECGDQKFEVKGRKSIATRIRLTENEWNAAKKLGKRYTLLLFTSSTRWYLDKAIPKQFPDPVRTEDWSKKATFEYFLRES